MATTRREPDAFLQPRQIGAQVWMQQHNELIRTLSPAKPQRNAVEVLTNKGTKRLNPRETYAVWFTDPEPHQGDPTAPF